jgi:hypothetical protein
MSKLLYELLSKEMKLLCIPVLKNKWKILLWMGSAAGINSP